MKWIRSLAGIGALASLTGCASLIPTLQTDPLQRNRSEILCVARYVQLTPDTLVGYDGCGNVWVKDTTTDKCHILSADGTRMLDIHCPAQGDTLSWIPGGAR